MTIRDKINNKYYETSVPYVPRKEDVKKYIAYYDDQNRLDAEFREDALKEVGLSKHPKKDKIFARAWQSGHANGYSEVYSHLSDLAELFDDELDFN